MARTLPVPHRPDPPRQAESSLQQNQPSAEPLMGALLPYVAVFDPNLDVLIGKGGHTQQNRLFVQLEPPGARSVFA